ncbi:MAG TPA: hypothetical protein VEF05_10105 [Terriglobales bacterium]|nr:hypothetical protein [Terriglobales bacterium]
MPKATVVLILWCAAVSLAQTIDTSAVSQHPSNTSKDEITVTGCVSKQNTDYILMQTDPGNSYELQSRKVHFRQYLGQEVEVSGTKSPTMSTSSDFLTRSGPGSPVTIDVDSIKTVHKRCSGE